MAFSRKLALEARANVDDGAGGSAGDWQVLGVHWAEMRQRSGRLETGLGGGVSRATYNVRVRAVGPEQPSRPRPGQRFRDGVRVYLIRSVTDARDGAPYLDCLTDEEVLP